MSPLRFKLVAMTAAFQMQQKEELEAWAKRCHAEIRAMAESRHRGIGQIYRHARVRVRAALDGPYYWHSDDFQAAYNAVFRRAVDRLAAQQGEQK